MYNYTRPFFCVEEKIMSETSMSMGDIYPVFEMEKYFTPKGCLYVETKSEVLKNDFKINNKQKNLSE